MSDVMCELVRIMLFAAVFFGLFGVLLPMCVLTWLDLLDGLARRGREGRDV